jgi:cell division protein FtsQ
MNAETLAVGESELRIPWGALRLLGITATVLATVVLAVQVAPYVNRPVSNFHIEGRMGHMTALQIAAAADVAPGTKLFAIDLDAVRRGVEALPWVGHAAISRAWPSGIIVDVIERQPVARWGGGGLLDSEGRAFTPPAADLPSGLPQLNGPDDRISDVWSAYQKLSTTLNGSLFELSGLNLDARGEWTAMTRSGITLRLGQEDPTAQGALIVGAVTRSLADRIGQVAYVDLRYPNGFSVGWKEAAPAPKTPKRATGGAR